MTKRYFVTGCAGFLGAAVCRGLIDAGHEVIGLDNLSADYDPLVKRFRLAGLAETSFRFRGVDLTRWDDLEHTFERAIEEQPLDGVLHFAARAGHGAQRPMAAYKVATGGTLRLLELCRKHGVRRFVLATGDSPATIAGAALAGAEGFCHAHHHLHGMDTAVLRFSTTYGPVGRPDQALFRYVRWISEGEPALVPAADAPAIDYLYIDDAVSAVLAALEISGGHTWQVSSGLRASLGEVVEILSILMGRAASLVPAESDGPRLWKASKAEAPQIPGWKPAIPLARGLCATLEWYETYRDVARLIDLGIEGRKRSRRTAARYRQTQRREAA